VLPLLLDNLGEMAEGIFASAFFGLMVHLLQVGALRWSHQTVSLCTGFSSFYSQGRLQSDPELTHYQFVQGGLLCCCFCQAAAALPYSYNAD
jgi:hypothetical protein